jgi:hypothetical protein
MMKPFMLMLIMALQGIGQTAGQNRPASYIGVASAMGQYRSLAEGAALKVKSALPNTSQGYNACRDAYAAAEESVEIYLGDLSDSLRIGRRDPALLPSADGATRASEQFFACALRDQPTRARMLPIAPFVGFAVTCLEHYLGRKKNGRDFSTIVTTEMRWKSWDRIR